MAILDFLFEIKKKFPMRIAISNIANQFKLKFKKVFLYLRSRSVTYLSCIFIFIRSFSLAASRFRAPVNVSEGNAVARTMVGHSKIDCDKPTIYGVCTIFFFTT